MFVPRHWIAAGLLMGGLIAARGEEGGLRPERGHQAEAGCQERGANEHARKRRPNAGTLPVMAPWEIGVAIATLISRTAPAIGRVMDRQGGAVR